MTDLAPQLPREPDAEPAMDPSLPFMDGMPLAADQLANGMPVWYWDGSLQWPVPGKTEKLLKPGVILAGDRETMVASPYGDFSAALQHGFWFRAQRNPAVSAIRLEDAVDVVDDGWRCGGTHFAEGVLKESLLLLGLPPETDIDAFILQMRQPDGSVLELLRG